MSIETLLKDKKKQRFLLFSCLWIAIALVAFLIREVLLPFILAALLAYVLEPAVSKLSKLRVGQNTLPRWIAVISIYIIIAAICYLFATIFLPELYRELLRMAKIATEAVNGLDEARIQTFTSKIDAFFDRYNLPIHIVAPGGPSTEQAVQIGKEIGGSEPSAPQANLISINLIQVIRNIMSDVAVYIRTQSADIVDSLQSIIQQVINFVFKFFLVLMLAGFILVDTDRIKRFVFNLIPMQDRQAFDAFLTRVDRGLSGVVRGQLLICLVNALLTLIGLMLLQVKFALVLATLAGVFSLIPIFGSIISSIPIALVALMKSPFTALLAMGWVVLIHALEANFLNPKILGNAAKIHPVLVVLALLVGEHFYGLVGALLAVPLASILLNIFNALLTKAQEQDN